MNFKKSISIVLGLILFISNGYCRKITPDIEPGVSFNDASGNIIFVPDEEITIDSQSISNILDTKITVLLSSLPFFIGDIFDYLFSSSEKNRLKFVPPDENSSNALSRELFPDGSPKPEDVEQGRLGLCYFFAVLSTVAEKNPDLIKESLVEDGMGNVMVRFFNPNNGAPYYVKVQKTVPELPNKLKFVSNDCLWVQMYLKAFVASGFSGVRGYIIGGLGRKNYKYAEGGFMDLVMRMITGKNTEIKNALSVWMSSKEKLYNKIEKSLSDSCCVTCDFSPHLNVVKTNMGGMSNEGLVRFHAYSIENVYKDENDQKWIVIRNPWGSFVSAYDESGKRVLNSSDDDNKGYSVLKFEDFLSQCGKINFCKNENIKKRGLFKRILDYVDPVPFIIRAIESELISGFFGIFVKTLRGF